MVISLIVSLLLSGTCNGFSSTHILNVKIKGLKEVRGNLHVCLMTKDEEFLSECAYSQSVKITSPTVKMTFENIPENVYCVSLFQDLDGDKILAKDGLFGLPSEPFGFSNNPSMIFGPPSFRRCSFPLDENKTLTIKLK